MKISRFRRMFSWAALAGGAILFFVYAFQAWMPTGYERIAGEHVESRKRADETLRSMARRGPTPKDQASASPLPLGGADRLATSPNEERQAKQDANITKVDFFNTLEGLARESDAVFGNPPGDLRQEAFLGEPTGSGLFWEPAGAGFIWVTGRRFDPESPDGPVELGEWDRKRLLAEAACAQAWAARERRRQCSEGSGFVDSISTPALQGFLDHTEDFLLRSEWTFPPIEGCPFLSRNTGASFQLACALALARASLRGDGDRAGEILKSYARARNVVVALESPLWWGPDDILPFALAGEADTVSNKGLEEADGILKSGLLNPETYDDMATVYAIRFRNRMIANMRNIRINAEAGTWAFFYSGAPRWCAWEALKPILSRRMDLVAEACVEGDYKAMWSRQRRLSAVEYLARRCRLDDPNPAFQEEWNCIRPTEAKRRYLNASTNKMRLLLAAARFRRDTGHDPRRVEDLVPGYLDNEFPIGDFSFLPLPAGRYPAFKDDYWAAWPTWEGDLDDPCRLDPLPAAVNAFWVREGRLPQSPEELKEDAPDSATSESFRDPFEWLDSRLLVRDTITERLYNPTTFQDMFRSLYCRYRLQLLPRERDAIDQSLDIDRAERKAILKAAFAGEVDVLQEHSLDTFEVAQTHAMAIPEPVVSSEFLDLLSQRGSP